jgi:hypothetical protein
VTKIDISEIKVAVTIKRLNKEEGLFYFKEGECGNAHHIPPYWLLIRRSDSKILVSSIAHSF